MAHGQDNVARAPSGAICVTVRLEALPNFDGRVAQMMAQFAESVETDEPGCTYYAVTRQIGSPRHFAAHARFVDWDAFNAHADTAHMRAALPELTAVLATPIALEIFVEI